MPGCAGDDGALRCDRVSVIAPAYARQQPLELLAARPDARAAVQAVALVVGERRATVLAWLGGLGGDDDAPYWSAIAVLLGRRSISVVPHCQQ